MPRNGQVRRPLTRTVVTAAATALTALSFASQATAAAPTTCTKVASPTGSDSAAGTEAAPFKTAQKLVKSLSAGQTGCLRAGVYSGSDIYMRQPDTALQSYPGERATLTSFLEIQPEAQRSRVSGLKIDTTGSSNSVGTKIQADDAVFSDNVVTKGGEGICVLAGTYNAAERIVIERNVMYDCGAAVKPDGSQNKFDHLIYLSGTRDAVIRWNILANNGGGWGVHMYPHADGTLVEHNIIDGNKGGVIFAGAGGSDVSDDNTVRNNAITSSGPRWNVEGSWSDGVKGTGNTASANCLYTTGPSQPTGIATQSGFTASGNTALDGSPYVNREAGDYRFEAGSPCAEIVGDVAGVISGNPTPVEAEPAPAQTGKGSYLKIVIRTDKHRVAVPRALDVKGKVLAHMVSVKRVKLQVKTRKGTWRTLARRAVSNGRFKARLRGHRLRKLRVARLRAVVPGKAHSKIVRVKVSRRAHR